MEMRTVKEPTIPLDEYAVVNQEELLSEALEALESATGRIAPDRQPPRAILVTDNLHRIVGQLGYLDILKGLEPKYNLIGNLDNLAMSERSEEFITSMMDSYNLLQDSFRNICQRAATVKVKEMMRPLSESIDEKAPLTEGIHKLVIWQTMRILVTREGEAVGVLRLAEVFAKVDKFIRGIKKT